MLKTRIAKLLDKEMDRRSFLVNIAAGSVALLGASAAFRAFSSNNSNTAQIQQPVDNAYGYGGAPYGR